MGVAAIGAGGSSAGGRSESSENDKKIQKNKEITQKPPESGSPTGGDDEVPMNWFGSLTIVRRWYPALRTSVAGISRGSFRVRFLTSVCGGVK
jgi:hypothetical protein